MIIDIWLMGRGLETSRGRNPAEEGRGVAISSHRISIRSSDVVTDSGSLSTICGDQGAVRRAAHHVDMRLNILV